MNSIPQCEIEKPSESRDANPLWFSSSCPLWFCVITESVPFPWVQEKTNKYAVYALYFGQVDLRDLMCFVIQCIYSTCNIGNPLNIIHSWAKQDWKNDSS